MAQSSETQPTRTIVVPTAILFQVADQLQDLARQHKRSESAQRSQAKALMQTRALFIEALSALGISYVENTTNS